MNQKSRFRPESVSVSGSFDSPIQHDFFRPLPDTHRDRFGNRFIGSGIMGALEKGYTDKDHGKARAGFLISPEGQQLLKYNPKLLSVIGRALILCDKSRNPRLETQVSSSVQIRFLETGGQAKVYQVFINGQPYIGKVQRNKDISVYDINQSFVIEMLQIQTLKAECGRELEEMNLALPQIYFATSQFMLREFVEGRELPREDIQAVDVKLKELFDGFLRQKRQEDPRLWDSVEKDLYNLGGFKKNNFIKTNSGRIVMIDPFAYYNVKPPGTGESFF